MGFLVSFVFTTLLSSTAAMLILFYYAGTVMVTVLGVICAAMSIVFLTTGKGLMFGGKMSLDPSTRWLDLYASADPVPNGPFLNASGILYSGVVNNRGSILTDHSGYWNNAEEFVGRVAVEVGQISGLDLKNIAPWDDQRLKRAKKRRAWRVRWLKFGRSVWLVASLALAFALREWFARITADLAASPVQAVFSEVMEFLESIYVLRLVVPDVEPSTMRDFAWIVGGLVIWLLTSALLRIVSQRWEMRDLEALFRREEFGAYSVEAGMIMVLSAMGCLIIASLVVSFFLGLRGHSLAFTTKLFTLDEMVGLSYVGQALPIVWWLVLMPRFQYTA
jgi:hypothetical protein